MALPPAVIQLIKILRAMGRGERHGLGVQTVRPARGTHLPPWVGGCGGYGVRPWLAQSKLSILPIV